LKSTATVALSLASLSDATTLKSSLGSLEQKQVSLA